MKKFKDDIEVLDRASPSKLGKRFSAFFIDFILVLLVGSLLFLGARSILESLPSYKENREKISQEINYYNEYAASTGLVEFIDEEKTVRKDEDIMVFENISRAIYHSYLKYNDPSKIEHVPTPGFVINNDKAKQYGEASFETDTVAAFYYSYAPANEGVVDYGEFTKEYYINWIYKTQGFSTKYSMFIFEEDNSDIPTLKTDVAYALYHYLYDNQDDDLTSEGKTYYTDFYNGYTYMLELSESRIIKAEPYYSTHYEVYRQELYTQSRNVNTALLISILLSYLIMVLVPKLIFRHQRSFGRMILGLGMIGNDLEETPLWITIVNTILGLFGFLVTATIMYLLPPFSGSFDPMMFPFLGNIPLVIILLIIVLLAGVNYVFCLFSHYKQSGIELLEHSILVDKHHLDEIDMDDQYEGKPQ